jgi:drug/metabolite transporter (DMT)-like permease
MSGLHVWPLIGGIVATSTAGDVLTAKAMRTLGDLDDLRAKVGLLGTIKAVVANGVFVSGVTCMALSFYTLLSALSRAEVSLVAPAAASLTFVTNAVAAKFFLHENVDQRRWISALLVCCGVVLLAK